MTFEELMVSFCAPTLAGMKVGSLFRCSFTCPKALMEEISGLNTRLGGRGVTVTVLEMRSGWALIYVYRGKQLERDMCAQGARDLLSALGYGLGGINEMIHCLRRRIRLVETFPHEIGLFLGYPLGDVLGFIREQGRNCKSCGLWKVYCNQQEADKLFEKYRKCTKVYCRRLREGVPLLKLTVAA